MQGLAGSKSFHFLADECSLGIDGILRLVDLRGLGVPLEEFVAEINPSFSYLPWDQYDCKNQQVKFLQNQFPQHKSTLVKFSKDFNWNLASLNDVDELVSSLSADKRNQFDLIRPYRKRAIGTYLFTKTKKWDISRIPTGLFRQTQNAFN